MASGSENRITVYHGSTSLIDRIDVAEGKPYKDFGRGFYLTRDFSHARNLAIRNKLLEKERYGRTCTAYVYTYTLDLDMAQGFSKKEFLVADLEWMRFILANRRVRDKSHGYDIIIGPTANDDTSAVLKSYYAGLYGDVESIRAVEIALELVEAENLPAQIYFGSNDATVCLVQKGTVRKV